MIHRRQFLRNTSALALAGFVAAPLALFANKQEWKDVVIGHGSHRYKVDLNWGVLDANIYPVNDCHEMVMDSQGRIILLTNHTKNNVIIYSKEGQLQEVWGTEFPGAHGLTLHVENGEDFLYISDNQRHEVIKTTIQGKIVKIFPFPKKSGKYPNAEAYVPTETAIAANGDIYVADGYGLQYIVHYNADGEFLNIFGGRGEGEEHFDNAHGICIDKRSGQEQLLITARNQNKLKQFSMAGELQQTIDLPGAYICRPVIHGNHVFLATIWSGADRSGAGFVSILDEKNLLISAPGGSTPIYQNGKLQAMHQALQIFQHPHDVCVDDEDNLYVAQWNSGKTYPIKLTRI